MLWAILIILVILVIVFAVLTFVVQHLFWIGLIVVIVLLIAHGGFLSRRH